jgi:hypothetical protein
VPKCRGAEVLKSRAEVRKGWSAIVQHISTAALTGPQHFSTSALQHLFQFSASSYFTL